MGVADVPGRERHLLHLSAGVTRTLNSSQSLIGKASASCATLPSERPHRAERAGRGSVPVVNPMTQGAEYRALSGADFSVVVLAHLDRVPQPASSTPRPESHGGRHGVCRHTAHRGPGVSRAAFV